MPTFLGRVRPARRSTVTPLDPPVGGRTGYGKPRQFSMMNGTVTVRRPRVRDLAERFESKILPLFKRRTTEVGMLLPELSLHGLSTGDFDVALHGLLGELDSATEGPFRARVRDMDQTDLSDLEVVSWWADGLYVKAGITDRKSAFLTIVGSLATGEKIVVACESGEWKSKDSWLIVLRRLQERGLKFPRLPVADGHLGIWAALGEIHPTGEEQRWWNHQLTTVLATLPKKTQATAGERLTAMP